MAIDISTLKTDHTAAVAAGDKFYIGTECDRPGHGRVRYVNGRMCLACCKDKARRRRLQDQSSRTDPDGFNRRVFILGDPKRILNPALLVHAEE
ncbi:hypothetical protein [Martelella alba]|uniref:Uncharacterized protein n=1 Tax=Martelella alba TaxID=2590451 RepID=A0ABY2SI27_9HYPH|nr:hypothetical protein [Martelella alba]TKI04807.1 hypothetical protein FCN80_16940 [Martelella alba]